MNLFTRQRKWLRPYSYLLIGLLLRAGTAVAQTPVGLSGTVVDAENGQGLPGVNVVAKGSSRGATTDGNGRYQLSVSDASAVLVFSYVGYTSQEITVGSQTTIDVRLVSDNKNLSEVVVIGYGTQKKVNLTGAVSTVDAKFLSNRPLTNATQALQGVQGVYVNQPTAQPGGDGATIRIRGLGTLGNNDPLVLVDGIAYSLRDVNPNDIATISVLKDAASAAIYGNRAANGVVLITTKSGQKGKARVDYSIYQGVQQVTYLPDAVFSSVDYMEGKNRALVNEGKQPEYTQTMIDAFKANPTDSDRYPNTNWFDVLFRKAPIQEHNLRFSGGSEKTTYSLSLGYLNQQGIVIGSKANKYSLGSNISTDINNRLKVGFNVQGTYWERNEPVVGNAYLMNLSFRALPTQPDLLSDGRYGDTWVRTGGHQVFRHPRALATEGSNTVSSLRTLANVFAEYQLPANFRYKISLAANYYSELRSRFVPVTPQYDPVNNVTNSIDYGGIPRSAYRLQNNELNLTMFHTLTWNQSFGKHNLSGLLGFSAETFKNSNFSAYREGFLDNSLTELNAGTLNPQVTGTSALYKLVSYFGRANYNYDERYLLEANFRYDGSTRFAQGNRWGIFPSVSAGWRINEEAFLKNASYLSNLKLRASWGQLGNQAIDNFSYVNAIDIAQNYSFNNTVSNGTAVNTLSDPAISWETTTISNIGLDAGFFNNRLTAELEYYVKKTSGILQRVTLPAQVGALTGPVRNIGDVENRGVELALGYRSKLGSLEYNVGGNVTYNQNKITNLGGQVLYGTNTISQEGYPINSWYMLDAIGIFQNVDEVKASPVQNAATQPGDIKYRDVNGDNKIDNNDRIITGTTFPKYTYAVNVGAQWKGFDFSALLQGVQGINTFPTLNYSQPFNNGAGVTRNWLTDSWTPDNPNASLPRLTTSNGYPQNFQASTFWLYNLSYLRLKNIQIGYTLPKALTQKARISSVRVYANAQNLVTWSPFKLADPERTINTSTLYEYPSASTITAGLNVSF
ncbi:SusC/RagA family TonB-linked outer membrane protein [Spirosoma validum]|uniref:TonB-dependent receptor n=1 Tax=Spirosoma validum TaxID=2771355 RepID=A0A927B7Y4_9BACT|nr:TonB-dependent receptor [Spirosoma validum]MBD2756807.1 TonB-dependent receptor [Spirosoma validum]